MSIALRDARPGQDDARPDFDNKDGKDDNNRRNTCAADSRAGARAQKAVSHG